MVFPSHNTKNGGRTVALVVCAALMIVAVYVVATFGGEVSALTEIDR